MAIPIKMPRVSILNLLLLIAIIALSLQLWRTTQSLKTSEIELKKLRSDVGHLEGTDPNKLQIVRIPTPNYSNRWRWRIRLPDGADARLLAVRGEIPKDGYSTQREKHFQKFLGGRDFRESVLDVEIWEDTGGNSGVSFSYDHSTVATMKTKKPIGFSLLACEEFVAGNSGTEEFVFSDRVPLLRLRDPVNGDEPAQGFLFWMSDFRKKDSVQMAAEEE